MSTTFLPGGQFAFPRSYLEGFYVRHEPGTFTWDGELLQFVVGVPPNALCKVYFDPRFVTWSSNRWTLDHTVTNATYTTIPGGSTFPLPFYLQWMIPPDRSAPHLLIDTSYGTLYDYIELPIAPDGYWLPRPLS